MYNWSLALTASLGRLSAATAGTLVRALLNSISAAGLAELRLALALARPASARLLLPDLEVTCGEALRRTTLVWGHFSKHIKDFLLKIVLT